MRDKNYKDMLKNLALLSQIGISVITPILLGVFLGRLIDKKLATKGIFVIIFIILGSVAGFLSLLKITGANSKKRK